MPSAGSAPSADGFVRDGQANAAEIDILAVFQSILQHWLLILGIVVMTSLAGYYYVTKMVTPKYLSAAVLALQSTESQFSDINSLFSGSSTDKAAINTEISVIRSRKLIQRLIEDLDLDQIAEFNPALRQPPPLSLGGLRALLAGTQTADPDAPRSEALDLVIESLVRDAVTVVAPRDTYLLSIQVRTTDPTRSARMANHLAEIYLDDQISKKFTATEYAVNWLTDRVSTLETELEEREARIKELRTEGDLISVEALEALSLRAKTLRERMGGAEADIAAAQDRKALLDGVEGMPRAEVLAMVGALKDPILDRLLRNDPAVEDTIYVAIQSRLGQLQADVNTTFERARLQQAALQSALDDIDAQLAKQNDELAAITQYERDLNATRALHETFLARLKETSLQVGGQQADSRILSDAALGYRISPRKTRFVALCIVLGALLGIAVAVLRHFRADGIRTPDELEAATGKQVFGQLLLFRIGVRDDLMTYLADNQSAPEIEAVRNLRTSLLLSRMDNPPRVMMITSSVPGEGKTTVSISLAQNLGGIDTRVLLIEGDIRRRTFREYFRDAPEAGLASVVSGEVPFGAAAYRALNTNFDVLLGDRSRINAADMFSSQRFRQFMETVREDYDYVIIDTPPVLVVPDARLIAPLVDLTVYAVCWDSTNRMQVMAGLKQFSSIGAPVDGLVLTQVNPKAMRRYGYDKQYVYSQYGKSYDVD